MSNNILKVLIFSVSKSNVSDMSDNYIIMSLIICNHHIRNQSKLWFNKGERSFQECNPFPFPTSCYIPVDMEKGEEMMKEQQENSCKIERLEV